MVDVSLKLQQKGVDLETILDEEEKSFKQAMRDMAWQVHDDIIQIANASLVTSRLDYINSMDFEDLGNLFIISIKEPGVHFENGFEAFDQKQGLIHGPHSKVSASGHRYNIVPFSHKGATTKESESKGQAYVSELKNTIKKMQQLAPPKEIRDRSGRVIGRVVAKTPKDIQGVTSGMIKIEKDYNKKKQSSYLTFRGVSEKSDPADWIHPGYKGLKAFEAVEKTIEDKIDVVIRQIFGV